MTAQLSKNARKTQLPNNARGVMEGFPIVIYKNGVKDGIYTFNTKQHGATVYGMDKTNPNHLIYRAECNVAGLTTSFRALSTNNMEDISNDWEDRFPKTNTSENREKLNRVISWVMTYKEVDVSSGSNFKNEISSYFNVEYLIDYWIISYALGMTDSLAKNLTLVTYDGLIWYPVFYDCDTSVGIQWQGSALKDTVKCPSEYQCTDSLLFEKFTSAYSEQIRTRYQELRFTHLKENNLIKLYSDFISVIPQSEFEYDQTKWDGIPSKNYGLEYMTTWLDSRLAYCDNIFGALPPDISLVTDGLVTHYDFREYTNSGNPTTVNDKSGNNNNLTLVNFAYTSASGFVEGGLKFNGTNNYCVFNTPVVHTSDFTIEVTVFKETLEANKFHCVIGNSVNASPPGGIQLQLNVLEIRSNVFRATIAKDSPVETNKYTTIFFQKKSNHLVLFVNGVRIQAPTGMLETNIQQLNATTRIGSSHENRDWFAGKIKTVKFYDRALLESEISKNYYYEVQN